VVDVTNRKMKINTNTNIKSLKLKSGYEVLAQLYLFIGVVLASVMPSKKTGLHPCVTSGFRRDENKIFVLLGCYAT
jgi:hypothetical protein